MFTGYNLNDTLSLRNGVTQIDLEYPFFMIDNANDIQDPTRKFPHDGILGLSPDVSYDDYLTLGVPMPVHLYRRKRIESPIIALDMNLNGKSTMQIGKMNRDKFRYKLEDDKNLTWVKVDSSKSMKWRALMQNVYYNRSEFAGMKIDDEGTVVDDGKKNYAVFDSFFAGIHLPKAEWVKLYKFEQSVLAKQGINLKCSFDSGYSCFYEG